MAQQPEFGQPEARHSAPSNDSTPPDYPTVQTPENGGTPAPALPSEHCPNAPTDDPGHCGHWYECEPCHRCGDDTPDPNCDCERCTAVREAS